MEQLESRELLSVSPYEFAPAAAMPASETAIAEFKSYFDDVMAAEHDGFLEMSLKGGADSRHLYNLQFVMDGVLSMYEATGDREVLGKAIQYATNIVHSAHVIAGGKYELDGYLDWESLADGEPRTPRQGVLLNDLQIGAALSRLARIVTADDRLAYESGLQSFAQELSSFVDVQIMQKWLDARGRRQWLLNFHGTYGYWTDNATHAVNICHDLSFTVGAESSCGGLAEQLARSFRELLVWQSDGSYLWDVNSVLAQGNHRQVPDTGHANREATMIARLAEDGFVFDQLDVLRMTKTFTQRIWNGRTDWEADPGIDESPWFRNYIDGDDSLYRDYERPEGPQGMSGIVYDGWVRLGQFNSDVQKAGEALLDFIQAFPRSVNAIRQRNGSPLGKIALAGHLARNLRFQRLPPHTLGLGDNGPSSPARIALINDDAGARTVATSLSVRPISGDADRDGAVAFADFLILADNLGGTNADWESGDFDGDGAVTVFDLQLLAHHYGAAKPLMESPTIQPMGDPDMLHAVDAVHAAATGESFVGLEPLF